MALPSAGNPISLNQVNVELGLSGTATISLNDAAVRILFNKSAIGTQISMSDGYSKSDLSIQYAVLPAGGGGGYNRGGGGGAGVYQIGSFALSSGTNYSLFLGAGGAGGTAGVKGSNGGTTAFLANYFTGGGGGTGNATESLRNGADSPAGGGGAGAFASNWNAGIGGMKTFVAPRGGDGGGSTAATGFGGGGGGSAGYETGDGEPGTTIKGGDGGLGQTIDFTGTPIARGGGGGGGGGTGGLGGSGGGGAGGTTGAGSAASVNTGGGGGGGGENSAGGNGGSAIAIFRYPSSYTMSVGAGLTSTTITVGSKKVTTVTAGTGTISWSA